LWTTPQRKKEIVMNHSPGVSKSRRQRTLVFPVPGRLIEIWNRLSDMQRQECRIAIRQLLRQVALDERAVRRDGEPDR
jgi:hypothetical protein